VKFPLLALLAAASSPAAELHLSAPLESSVMQRSTLASGTILVSGTLSGLDGPADGIDARLTSADQPGDWQKLTTTMGNGEFHTSLTAPAGGWYRLEVRVARDGKTLAESGVAAVGVGEVFVVAGQSNSANHGEERQVPKTGLVVTFDGKRWVPAQDPQPGASGGGGSFLPPFGDAIAQQFHVPVGFIACGVGATSVREWLPAGVTFPQPPTLTGQVQPTADGAWESKGGLFDMLVMRMKQPGPRGFRAVLWHQGESDANQADPSRTLPGGLYHDFLAKVIGESRHRAGWEAPWFVAQASYHIPGDEASASIRAAQLELWKDGTALEGPDSDALKGSLRENGGKGVHFSGPGLREHAARWVEKVAPWLEARLTPTPPAAPGP